MTVLLGILVLVPTALVLTWMTIMVVKLVIEDAAREFDKAVRKIVKED